MQCQKSTEILPISHASLHDFLIINCYSYIKYYTDQFKTCNNYIPLSIIYYCITFLIVIRISLIQ